MQMATTAVEKVPGADRAKELVDGVLDSVGIVSPRARRVAAYTGAGLLGVAGVVEWPVVAAGAAAVWLTQQRPKDAEAARMAGEARAEGAERKHAARSAKASAVTGKAKAGKATSGTAKTRTLKSASTTGMAKAGRTTKSASAAVSRTKAGGRKKT
jgi:hypothetical protein